MKNNPYLVNANLLKRTGAAFFDFVIFIIFSLVFLSYIFGPLYDRQFGTVALSNQLTALQEASYLYTEDETTNQLRSLTIEEMPEGIYQYYAEFKNNKIYLEEEGPFIFSITWFNEFILEVNETTSLFILNPQQPGGVAIVKDGVSETDLNTFYNNAYRDALIDLNTYPVFIDLVNLVNRYFVEVLLFSAGLSLLITYLLFPLLFKDGQTLGKRTLGLAVVHVHGYPLKWWQSILRMVVLGITYYTAPFTVLGSLLISYTLMVFTKNNRSGHDYLSWSRVINKKQSLIFKTEHELLAYQKNLEQSSSVS